MDSIRSLYRLFTDTSFSTSEIFAGLSSVLYSKITSRPVTIRGVVIDPSTYGLSVRRMAGMQFGAYEENEKELIASHLPEDVDVIELGAGTGWISGHIQQVISGGTKHVAVEANPYLIPTLARHSELNGGFSFVFGAVSDGHGQVHFDTRGNCSKSRISSSSRIPVPGVTIAMVREQYDIPEYSLVMDIEGAEEKLVTHADLDRCRLLIVETHPSEDTAQTVREELADDFELVEVSEHVHVFERLTPNRD